MAINLLFNLHEIFDMVLMSLVFGFIFKDLFIKQHRAEEFDPISHYKSGGATGLWSDNFKFAIMVTAPAVILHELGHKFVALSAGATAEFHASYTFLGIALLLKLLNTGILLFVPAYVSWVGNISYFQSSAIAFAGPCVNLILWLAAWAWLKYFPKAKSTKKYTQLLVLTRKINIRLFFFNMIPLNLGLFSFDGYHVFYGLLKGFGIL